MRNALFGDIHGNLEALEAVLGDAAKQDIENYFCLGDVVGYGANPKECISRVQALECPVVKGNHDEDASTTGELYGRSRLAQAAMVWTREQLDADEKRWLRELNLQHQADGFTVVHASLSDPVSWPYVLSELKAISSFAYQCFPICFIGHTHSPITYIHDKQTGEVESQKDELFKIDSEKQYLVNVGSTGQPRDGDWRASYAVYDSQRATVEIRRLEYDIDTACEKILRADLPPALAERLRLGR